MEAAAGASGGGTMEMVVLPWLAFGHMIPFLELSKRLAARGHTVTFVSTPRNLARLPPVPPHLSARLRFVSLPLPRVDGLPEGAESTADVPPGKDEFLKKAMDGLAAPLAAFLADAVAAGRRPDWIINDFCHHWLPPIAAEHKVPCALFQIILAGMAAYIGPRWANPRMTFEDLAVTPEWFPFSSKITYTRHEARWLAGFFQPNASDVSDAERFWQINEQCHVTIYRSCYEIESGMFTLLADLFQKPSIPAGTLPPPYELDDDESIHYDVMRWLDDQPSKSVIYVALGSEAPVSVENLQELALGLELADVRFMWALRRPKNTNHDAEADTGRPGVLPEGFKERTRDRGLVSTGWVPQVKLLGHGAVGAFLTHCGWGSTLESFMFGLPLVMLPFVVDQPLVARTMVEKGLGVEVERDKVDGSFYKDGVAAAVRRVMVEEEGKVLASNAKRLREVLADKERQEQYIDNLVDNLRRCKDV